MITDDMLTYQEVLAVTGYKRVSDQERYLKSKGVPCWVNRAGELVAIREAVISALDIPGAREKQVPSSAESRLHIDEVS